MSFTSSREKASTSSLQLSYKTTQIFLILILLLSTRPYPILLATDQALSSLIMARFLTLVVLLVPFLAVSCVANTGWFDRAVYRKDEHPHPDGMWLNFHCYKEPTDKRTSSCSLARLDHRCGVYVDLSDNLHVWLNLVWYPVFQQCNCVL